MNKRTKKLLKKISDGKWYSWEERPNGVGRSTIETCYHSGLISIIKINVRFDGCVQSFRYAFRITKKGLKALS